MDMEMERKNRTLVQLVGQGISINNRGILIPASITDMENRKEERNLQQQTWSEVFHPLGQQRALKSSWYQGQCSEGQEAGELTTDELIHPVGQILILFVSQLFSV